MNTSINKKALLVGNGVNLLDDEQSFSWGGLLTELKNRFGINVDLDNVFKPFPLAFDEMQHLKAGSNEFEDKIKRLKQTISKTIQEQLNNRRGYNEFHTKLMNMPYNDYLTTNYDYSLEKCIVSDFYNQKNKLTQSNLESKHSLRRHYMLQEEKKVWHIHGELFDSRNLSTGSNYYPEESIMIGYEHYAEYLGKIQENIKGKPGNQKVDSQSLLSRFFNKQPSPFWIDIFFTHDVDIIGQALDFSENHLWWLLNYRAKMTRTNHITSGAQRSNIIVDNKVRYYYPEIRNSNNINITEISNLNNILDKLNATKKAKAVAEVLGAFNVEPMPILCDSYQEFYSLFIQQNHRQ